MSLEGLRSVGLKRDVVRRLSRHDDQCFAVGSEEVALRHWKACEGRCNQEEVRETTMDDRAEKILEGLMVFSRGGLVRCSERVVGLSLVERGRDVVVVTEVSCSGYGRGEARNELAQRTKTKTKKQLKRRSFCCCQSIVGSGVQKKLCLEGLKDRVQEKSRKTVKKTTKRTVEKGRCSGIEDVGLQARHRWAFLESC